MTEKTISVQYYSTYSELVTFMGNLNNLVQTRELLRAAFLVQQTGMEMSL